MPQLSAEKCFADKYDFLGYMFVFLGHVFRQVMSQNLSVPVLEITEQYMFRKEEKEKLIVYKNQ